MTADQARARLASARVARLATVSADGRPHAVPICFAVAGDTIVTAVDHKPKRTTALRRLANIEANPAVAVLADAYDDRDWTQLWWTRADGTATVLAPEDPAAARLVALLVERYEQYRAQPPAGPVIRIAVDRWSGWAAAPAPTGGPPGR